MKKHPISVIVPVKNAEDKIENCINALLSQTIKSKEILIVDGHSTDNTVKIAKKYPVKILFEQYGTIGGGRKVGVEAAEGYFIASTDSDCIPKSDWLENLVKEYKDELAGVGGATVNISKGLWGNSISLVLNSYLGSADSVQDRIFPKQRYVKSISGCNSFFRKKDLIDVGNYSGALSINEDTLISKKVRSKGKLLYTPDAVVYHDQDRDIKAFSKRIYSFAEGRVLNGLFDIQMIPPISLVILLLLLFFFPTLFLISVIFYAILLLVFTVSSIVKLEKKRFLYFFSVPIVFVLEHLSYSLGFWVGLFHKISGKL